MEKMDLLDIAIILGIAISCIGLGIDIGLNANKDVTSTDVALAQKACEPFGGIATVSHNKATCNNSITMSWNSDK